MSSDGPKPATASATLRGPSTPSQPPATEPTAAASTSASASTSAAPIAPNRSSRTQHAAPTSNSASASTSTSAFLDAPPSAPYRALRQFSFPRAAQPEVVRAYQKDAYYRDELRALLVDVVRSTFGARSLQGRSEQLALLASVTYFVACAVGGAQTLGEEYVNAIMVDSRTRRMVTFGRRMFFIALHVLLPSLISRGYAAMRRRLIASDALRTQALHRARLRAAAMTPRRRDSAPSGDSGVPSTTGVPQPSRTDRLVSWLASRLPGPESLASSDGWLAYLAAVHLAVFYLGGRYYAAAQRVARVEYISALPRPKDSRGRAVAPPSYEVLGVLLGMQLVVRMGMALDALRQRRAARKREERKKARERQRAEAKRRRREERMARLEKRGGGDDRDGREADEGEDEDEDEDDALDEEERLERLALQRETVAIDGTLWSHKTSPAKPLKLALAERGVSLDEGEADEEELVVPLAFADPDVVPSAQELGLGADASAEALEAARAEARTRAAELEAVAQNVLRCTLCMEQREPQRGTSAVTECGHVFCWECIVGWTREKPECPLCRQSINPSHILPVYNL